LVEAVLREGIIGGLLASLVVKYFRDLNLRPNKVGLLVVVGESPPFFPFLDEALDQEGIVALVDEGFQFLLVVFDSLVHDVETVGAFPDEIPVVVPVKWRMK
jgi:hypothetical protein